MKIPDSSTSAAEDMTDLIIWAIVKTGPLIFGTGTSSDSMMCDPYRLQDLLKLR